MKLFRLENVTKVFGGTKVLDIKRLELDHGVNYALLGPNGAGKTTLLEILAFLSAPTSGHVWFRGVQVTFPSRELGHLRRKVVMVHQQPVLFSTTVYKNVEFGLKVRGFSRRERNRIVEECLEMVGMRHAAESYSKTLSGGEKQRVAIARGLACSPEVLLLDEPTASVDQENQVVIERIITEISALKGISVIFTTHDIRQAGRISSHIVYLYEGKALAYPLENIFSTVMQDHGPGKAKCRLKGGLVEFEVATKMRGEAKISIDPRKILLLRSDSHGLGEATFEGRVMGIVSQGMRGDGTQAELRVEVEMGIPLNVFMDRERAKELGLFVGEKVIVKIPEDAIMIF